MVENWQRGPGTRREDADLLYINCGGHEGLYSQLCRYRRLGLLGNDCDPESLLTEVRRLASASTIGG